MNVASLATFLRIAAVSPKCNSYFRKIPLVLRKFFASLSLLFVLNVMAGGQNMSGVPDYGSYIHTGSIDTVSAVDGQVAVNLPFSSHPYRGFNYQFGMRYTSNIWHLTQGFQACNFSFTSHQNCSYYNWTVDDGGWHGSSNIGGELKYSDTQYYCTSIYDPSSPYYNVRAKYAIRGNYLFRDYASGRIYQFPVRKYRKLDGLICPEIGQGDTDVLVAPSDEGGMQLDITNDVPSGTNMGSIYKITTKDGTIIRSDGQKQQIIDTNGNTLTFGSVNNGLLPIPAEDAPCTPLAQIGATGTQNYSQFFCYVDSNGVTQNVRVDWTKIPVQPSFPTKNADVTYQSFIQSPGQLTVVSKITLPNNLAYTFSYDPVFGVLTKIGLPTGGYIRYTWTTIARRLAIANPSGLFDNIEQAQDVLALATRNVSEDGVHEQTWQYNYRGSFQSPWTTTIIDPLGNQEVHKFSSGPSVEIQTQYLDATGKLLKQVDNIWGGTDGTVQLGFALASPQDNLASMTLFAANDSPNAATGLDVMGLLYDDAQAKCAGDPNCLSEATAIVVGMDLSSYMFNGIGMSMGTPQGDGTVAYNGPRNTVLLSRTMTIYNGSRTLATTTQTDYNDCSTFMNFNYLYSLYVAINSNHATFLDCRDNPTQIREYGYDLAANNAIANFNSGHSASNAAPASRYTDISYLHQTNSASGPANYSVDSSHGPNGPFIYESSGLHIMDRVAEKKIYDGVNSTSSSPGSDAKATYDSYGNALTRSAWLNTNNSWITSSFTYDSYGNMLTSSDANANVTTYDYTDNYTDSTKNTGSARFVTKITLPSTGDVSHVTRKAYDWNTGLVMATCGENYTGSTCTAGQSPTSGQIPDYTNQTFDLMNRPLTIVDGGGGQTQFAYNESSLPVSISMTTKHDAQINVVHTAVLDGLGRTKQTQWITAECTVKTDTTYDAVGRVSTVSNPYCSTSDPTYGVTTTEYDALGRVIKVIPQDGTSGSNNVTTNYSNPPTVTVTDQVGNLRRTTADAFGRLIRVDEPGSPTTGTAASGSLVVSGPLRSGVVGAHGATQASGSLTINGSERTMYVPGDPVCVMYGDDGSCVQWQTPYYPVCDVGQIKLTVGGHLDTTAWGCNTKAADIASALANAINNDGAALVWANVSGATLNLSSRAAASAANFSWSLEVSDGDPPDFDAGSFSASPANGSMTGGTDAFGGNTVYDSGTAKLTVGNFSSPPVPYGSSQNSTAIALAASLAQAFTNASGAPATATASGVTISIVYKTLGAAGNVADSVSSTPDNPTLFPGGSFSSSGSLAGGDDPDATGINHPLVTLYQYDVLGDLLRVDQKGSAPADSSQWRTRTFAYDSLGHLLTAQNPESGRISYNYDAAGNLLQKTSPAPNTTAGSNATQTISYCYDALNRVTGKAYSPQTCSNGLLPAGTAVVAYGYDSGTNGVGRESSRTDPAGSGAYTYDAMGRMAGETRVLAGVSKTMSYEYNPDGSLKILHYPSGAAVTYGSDSAGRIVSVVDQGRSINYVTSATYAPSGGLAGFVSGNSGTFAGMTSLFSYNKRLQPMSMSASAPNQTVFSIGYDFHLGAGNNGNVFAILNNRDHTRDQTFTYDALNRLASAQNAGTDCSKMTLNGKNEYWANSYSYDPFGNLTDKTKLQNVCGGEDIHFNVNSQNQVHPKTGADYIYDIAGNMTADYADSVTATYDPENRIQTASASGTTRAYTYDADGNRVKKTSGSSGTLYWYMSPGIVAESDLSGNLTSEYVFFNGQRVARRDNPNGPSPTVVYYFSDHLKTTNIVTDATGHILNESDYYPWGGELQFANADSNHYKFTGKERDTETGLDYFGARYYSNGLGRFITPDWAAKATAVPYAEFADPQSLNLYSYVRNLPTTRFDVDGHCDGPGCLLQVLEVANRFAANPGGFIKSLFAGAGKQEASNFHQAWHKFGQSPPPANPNFSNDVERVGGAAFQSAVTGASYAAALIGKGKTEGEVAPQSMVFRGSELSSDVVFREGFTASGTNKDLLEHAFGSGESAFVSTSQSFDQAAGFGPNVYVIRPLNGINVNDELGSLSPFPQEREVAIPCKIDPSDIRAVTHTDQGVSVLNPNYKP